MSWTRRLAPEPGSPDYLLQNRTYWDAFAPDWVERGRLAWGREPSWGVWSIPETELGVLGPLTGRDALEVGCGTAYVSAWMARAGANPLGLDNSVAQLRTAAMLQAEYDLPFHSSMGRGSVSRSAPKRSI